MLRWVVASMLLASCYSPSLRDSEVTCSGGVCPAGFRCVDQVRRLEGASPSATSTFEIFSGSQRAGGPFATFTADR